jgi:carbamoyltransferase
VSKPVHILGLSAFYHDSAACLLRDGVIVAAAQEERFTRRKHDERFPENAVAYCLLEGGLTLADVDHVAFYEKPFLKFDRLLHTYLAEAPRGLASFLKAMPVWLKDKLWQKAELAERLQFAKPIFFAEHHESHAGSAFFPSPFAEAAILTVDGVGEWTTTSFGVGRGNRIELWGEQHFPHSLGLLYSAFTHYCGFKVNSGEYKLMGLAPYGEPRFVDAIRRELLDLRDDGSFRLNLDSFGYTTGLRMTNARFDAVFGAPARTAESRLTAHYMDVARSIQEVTEEILFRMARHVRRETGLPNLCLAGGVALNCVANGRILREGVFDRIWIQPAAGDAGGALGAALVGWHHALEQPRTNVAGHDAMRGSYLGPAFGRAEIEAALGRLSGEEMASFVRHEFDEDALPDAVAGHIADGKVVGWFQGRMEFGPRALGARSILGDARSPAMQETMNLKIKFRESFRPFAPSVLRERVGEWFQLETDSPYMLLVAPVHPRRCRELSPAEQARTGMEKLLTPRSEIPAVTHVDNSARVQTVAAETNPLYHRLLRAFEARTGCPVIINTSFNVRGEPIVCTPADALRCFLRTNMDVLAVGPFVLEKTRQLPLDQDAAWLREFELD